MDEGRRRGGRGVLWAVLAGFVVGLGLVAVVAASDSGSGDGPKRLPALALAGGAERASAAGDAATMLAPAGPVEIRVRGSLPALDGSAAAWRAPAGDDVPGRVAALARKLGVDGDVQRAGQAWRVGAGKAGPTLEVSDVPGLPWSYSAASPCTVLGGDQAVSSDAVATVCGVAGGAAADGPATSQSAPAMCKPCPDGQVCADVCLPPDGPVPLPVDPPQPPEPPQRPADLPSQARAEAIARDLTGLPAADADARVDDGGDRWFVTLDPRLDGRPTIGWSSFVTVGDKGAIDTAGGWLAEPVRGEDYPLAGTAAGVERLRNGAWGIGPQPLAVATDAAGAAESRAIAPGEPAPDTEPVVRTITGAEVGLAWSQTADGHEALLVPVYVFTFDDGGTTPVLAVADEFLPPEPKPEPSPAPEPRPIEPGAGASGSCQGSGSAGPPDTVAGQDPNRAPTTSICSSPDNAAVGDEVVFTVQVDDPDGPIATDDCNGPHVSFGDGTDDGGRCIADCAAPPPGPPPTAGDSLRREYRHTYEKPGPYTFRFDVGLDCGNPRWSNEVHLEVAVDVAAEHDIHDR